jgi:hypothetical protein
MSEPGEVSERLEQLLHRLLTEEQERRRKRDARPSKLRAARLRGQFNSLLGSHRLTDAQR